MHYGRNYFSINRQTLTTIDPVDPLTCNINPTINDPLTVNDANCLNNLYFGDSLICTPAPTVAQPTINTPGFCVMNDQFYSGDYDETINSIPSILSYQRKAYFDGSVLMYLYQCPLNTNQWCLGWNEGSDSVRATCNEPNLADCSNQFVQLPNLMVLPGIIH